MNCSVSVIVLAGIPPTCGKPTPVIVEIEMVLSLMGGKTTVNTPEFAALVTVAPETIKKFAGTP